MSFCTLADGRRFFYREAGTGKTLLLLHGWSMSSAVFQEVMQLLANDFHVLVPDLSGHGESELSGVNFDLDMLAADIESLLAQLEIDTIHLLGWSLGGQVALQMIKRAQIQVEKLILVATTPLFVSNSDWKNGLPPTQVRAMDRQIQRHYEQSMSEFFRLMFDGEEIPPERYRDIIRFAVRDGSLPERDVCRTGLKILGTTDLRRQLIDLHLPVLVHYGLLDQITDPAAGHYIAEQIPSATEVAWEDVGHAPFLSKPDDSAVLWREFLQ